MTFNTSLITHNSANAVDKDGEPDTVGNSHFPEGEISSEDQVVLHQNLAPLEV